MEGKQCNVCFSHKTVDSWRGNSVMFVSLTRLLIRGGETV